MNIIFIGILFLPIVQRFTKIIPTTSLYNVEVLRKLTPLNWTSFESGKFQAQFDKWYLEDSKLFGLLVKSANTINYKLFSISSSGYQTETLIGNNYSLFDKIYINDLNGIYISKYNSPVLQVQQLKKLQDYLVSKGKAFLLVIHPNKAIMNPDWVPDSFRLGQPRTRYIELLKPLLDAHKINYLLVSEHLKSAKRYFPKSGAHLNSYGKCLSAKNATEQLNQQIAGLFPSFDCIAGAEVSASGEDLDLANLLNVRSSKLSIEKVPALKIKYDSNYLPKTNLMLLGTSYVFGLLEMLNKVRSINSSDFIFYDKTHYFSRNKYYGNKKSGRSKFTRKLHTKKFLDLQDALILESTEARLHQLGFGFLESISEQIK